MKPQEYIQLRQQRRIGISVLQKGVVFLVVAVVLAGIFLFQLFQLTSKAELLAKREAQLSEITEWANGLNLQLMDGLRGITVLLFLSDSADTVDPESFRIRTEKDFNKIEPLLVNLPGYRKVLKEARVLAKEEYEVLKSLKSSEGADSRSVMETVQIIKELTPRVRDLGFKLFEGRQAIEQERATITRTRQEEQHTRDQLKRQIIFGAIIAVSFFLFAAIVFLTDITHRLGVLVGNARQIPTGKTLHARVSGTDELAYLDEVLHQASAQLLKSAEHRKSLMEMIAHDLRSPLSASLLSLQLLIDTANKTGQSDPEKIKAVRDNLAKIISLVENLLTIDKLEAGELTLDRDWLNIKDLVDEAINVVSPLATVRNLTVVSDVRSEHVEADKLRIMQVLNNLLTNAIKFSPEAGLVRVTSSQTAKELKISISDQGASLEKKDHDKLFNKFFQADNKDEGNLGFGLGLAITKLIVEAHSGQVGIMSAQNAGSIFWFSLPMDEQLADHTIES